MLVATVALAFVVQLVTTVGARLLVAAGGTVSVASVVQAAVTLAIYRLRIGDDNLTPHRPRDIVGPGPGQHRGRGGRDPARARPRHRAGQPAFDLFWWAALSTAYVFVGAGCIMLLVQRRPRTEAIPTRLLDVYVQLLVTAVCLGVVFAFEDSRSPGSCCSPPSGPA